jgi:hypothetical protein
MRLQVVSDLHLETREKQTFETILLHKITDTLALLGDIAPLDHPNLRRFLEWCSERWKTVLYVPGTLECSYMPTVPESVTCLREMCARFGNIHVLYRDAFYSEDGLLVLGCPFWSFSPDQPKALRLEHREDLNWVRAMTKSYTNPCLVLSHFGPVEWVQGEESVGDPSTAPMFTETELLLREPIIAWAFGHCHKYLEYSKSWSTANGIPRSVLLICNGLGFGTKPGQRRRLGPAYEEFRMDAVMAIDPRRYS